MTVPTLSMYSKWEAGSYIFLPFVSISFPVKFKASDILTTLPVLRVIMDNGSHLSSVEPRARMPAYSIKERQTA